MKAVSIIVGALAAIATAAPAKEARSSVDLSQLNNLAFSNVNFQYLNVVNSLDLQVLEQLSSVNNFNLDQFQSLFDSNDFQLQELLQFQQLQQVVQLAQLGLFNQFDLSNLNFQNLQFGLINSLTGFDFNSLIDPSLNPQITQIASTAVVLAKE